MHLPEGLRACRAHLAVIVGVVVPLVSGLAWCAAGRPLTGLLGVGAAVVGARVYRRRMGHPLFLLPTWLVGDPNKRRPIIINRTR